MLAESTEALVDIGDTRLHIVERGHGYPLIILHGGPGLDHHMFGDYLDPLTDEFRLILVDQRAQGLSTDCPVETWTLRQMAADVIALARALGLARYAVLGHSYGSFVALQNAVDFPGHAAQTIVSCGVPSARYLTAVDQNLAAFAPIELREQVTTSWAREREVSSPAQVADLLHDQQPFHFASPNDARIAEYERRSAGAVFSPRVLRHFARAEYGGIEVEDRLELVPQPVLLLAGRHDRTCVPAAAEAMNVKIPHAEMAIFEHSGHMTFVEENERYLAIVREFLSRHRAGSPKN